MNHVSVGRPGFRFPGFFLSLFSREVMRGKWRMNYFLAGVLALFVVLVFSPLTVKAGIIFSVDYDNGSFGSVTVRPKQPGTGYPSLCCNHSAQIVTAPVQSGSKAVKMMLLPKDEGYGYEGKYFDPFVRAEFEKQGLEYKNLERWYALSVYIDPSYTATTKDTNGVVLSQWGVVDDGPACDKDAAPPLMLRYLESNSSWRVFSAHDAKACSTTQTLKVDRFNGPANSMQKGVWIEFVVNIRWSLTNGFLKVWKDGSLIVNKVGPTILNNENNDMLWKWGMYKSNWRGVTPPTKDKLVAYFDEIRIGDANSSYAEVALKGSPSPAPRLVAPGNLLLITNTD